MTDRRAVTPFVAIVLALTAVACGGASERDNRVAVHGVRAAVPDGWTEQPAAEAPDVVTSRRWAPDGAGVEGLQVVIGCDGTAEELAAGAAQAPRDPLVVTDAVELAADDVPGLDAVHRLRLTLGGGRQDDASTVRIHGLYGEAGDTLVLVEVFQRAGQDAADAAAVLDSVGVDAQALQDACAEPG